MDYDHDRSQAGNEEIKIEDVRKAIRGQRIAKKEHRKFTRSLIFKYAAELLQHQKEPGQVINTVISYSFVAAYYLQMGWHMTKKETYEIHKAGWWIYRKQSTRRYPARR